MTHKRRVLFLCTGNSARSQMAEALLKHRASDDFDVFSAGTAPESIDQRALDALNQFGVTTSALTSNHLDEFIDMAFDFVITLCDSASKQCRRFNGAKQQLSWDLADPKHRDEPQPFWRTLDEINQRLTMFLQQQSLAPAHSAPTLSIEPVVFYKALSDDIRLKTLMLSHYHGELCVCELMTALGEASQPKVSRNLAVLKKANIITDRKNGQWVFYQINPNLPMWAKDVIAQTSHHNTPLINQQLKRLAVMSNRPDKTPFCN